MYFIKIFSKFLFVRTIKIILTAVGILFSFVLSFYGRTCGILKFLDWGSNQSCRCLRIAQPHQCKARPGIKPATSQTLCRVPNPLSHNGYSRNSYLNRDLSRYSFLNYALLDSLWVEFGSLQFLTKKYTRNVFGCSVSICLLSTIETLRCFHRKIFNICMRKRLVY